MPDTTDSTANPVDTSFAGLVDALVELIRTGVRPDVLEAQRVLLQRLSTQGDVFPARIPAPLNITEIGGYLNVLERAGLNDLRSSAVSGALGIAGPALSGEALAGVVPVGFVNMPNDRPPGPAQASIPPLISVRADFFTPLMMARETLQAAGAALPLRSPRATLPASQPAATASSLDNTAILAALGRRLTVFPGTILIDPASDPAAIARPESPATEPLRLVVRELDSSGTIAEANWVAMRASANAVVEEPAAPRRYLEVAPVFAAAGWIHPEPFNPPTTLSQRGTLTDFVNITGLVIGETTLGDELALLYSPAAIARSALSAFTTRLWDGNEFVAPA